MGASANVGNVPQILKEIWADEVEDFMYADSAYHGLVGKDTSWSGQYLNIVIETGGIQRSSTFDKAKANKGVSSFGKMQLETDDEFVVWSVDHKLITLSRNDRGALVRALDHHTTRAFTKLRRAVCWKLWGNGGGAIAKIASISTTNATLTDANDIRNFDIGDVCTFAVDDGYTASAGEYVGTRTVSALNEDTGVVTFDSTLVGLATTNDYIFPEGDYAASFKGVPFYIPQYDPGVSSIPSSIWGMTQTTYPTRLAGHRMSGSNLSVVESLKSALTKAVRRNIKVSHIFVPPEVFNEVDLSLGTQRRYASEKVGRVGYEGIEFAVAGRSAVKLFPDADIRSGRGGSTERLCYGLNLDKWKLHSADAFPSWLTSASMGDKKFLTEENNNASEGRIGGYVQHYTNAPGQNFVLVLS